MLLDVCGGKFSPTAGKGGTIMNRILALVVLLVSTEVGAATVEARRLMIAAAHPLAVEAGVQMLERGGAAIDAAVAVQAVLGVVEPQSSSLGGGGFILRWDAAAGKLEAFDGIASAPAAVTASLRTDVSGRLLPLEQVRSGGRSVGVPGVVRLLAEVHQAYGRLPWASLFEPAIRLAEGGFPIARYVASLTPRSLDLASDPVFGPMLFDADGRPKRIGTITTNPALGASMRAIAADPEAFYRGPLAEQIVRAVASTPVPGLLTLADLAGYRVERRDPICRPFLDTTVCTMPPPSYGGFNVLQTLAILQAHGIQAVTPGSLAASDLRLQASRIANADRRGWIADPAFHQIPIAALLTDERMAVRAKLLVPGAPLAQIRAGDLGGAGHQPEAPSETSHMSIVAPDGEAISFTTTTNLNFGARIAPGGIALNNAMTNFSTPGQPNRMQGGKRPITSMAPTMAFDRAGRLILVGGAAGGGFIDDYIVAQLVGVLAWGLDPATALSLPHLGVEGNTVDVEANTPLAAQVPALRAMGHDARAVELRSGGQLIQRLPLEGTLRGSGEPRRDGVAIGR